VELKDLKIMKQLDEAEKLFVEWFYQSAEELVEETDYKKPVNYFDGQFNLFMDFMENKIKEAYIAGYEKGKDDG
jgi:hypothetical protein